MVQPVWITPAGDLGTYNVGYPINLSLSATAMFPASYIEYKFLGGELPNGLSMDRFGNITGIPKLILLDKTSIFTIRVINEFNDVRDRTFSMTISNINIKPKITTIAGEILNVVDSKYVKYQIEYINEIQDNKITFSILSGYLPPGLYLDPAGIIKGYPDKPVLGDNSPASAQFNFTILLSSGLGNDSAIFSIVVRNQQLSNTPNTRTPAILNRKPLTEPIDINDPYYGYYLSETAEIPAIKTNEYFSFKIIGKDFDNNQIEYQIGGLPPGLVGNNLTGWITGFPTETRRTISKYDIHVTISKKDIETIITPPEIFGLTVYNDVLHDIVWNTTSDLGTIFNGDISMLKVSASATESLVYELVDGVLPKNLVLLETGIIAGRVAQQSDRERVLKQGESTEFNFTVRAFSREFPSLSLNKQFKITVYQRYPKPLENIYFKAFPNKHGKQIINYLLSDTSLIPNEYLYRPDDMYFGKATDVTFVHLYGMESTSIPNYVNATLRNHYERTIRLGELNTAVATDDSGNIIYEVVYSTIIDELEDGSGVPPAQKISLNNPLSLRLGPWVINNNEILIDSTIIKVTASPGSTNFLYPAGLQNMRAEVASTLPQNFDSNLLPLWMTSQQPTAQLNSTLGYRSTWVVCYTKPGYSEIIKNNINSNWTRKLNEIDFTIDRFIVDKSATFNWNTNLAVPAWTDLPSATPVPLPLNSYDAVVLFAKKTILPNS